MDKQIIALITFLIGAVLYAQPDTEVYTFILNREGSTLTLTDPRNISNNKGYDNQPSFYDDNTVLFTSTRDGQTDILKFNIQNGSTTSWITDTPTGSEYSPLRIPESDAISAIRLDLNGLQRLYTYDPKNGSSEILLNDLKVGYYVWYTPKIVVTTVLNGNQMDLSVSNLTDNTHRTYQKNVGRSLQKIPNTKLISYISKAHKDNWELKSLDPVIGATKKIVSLGSIRDVCWLPNGTLIAGKEKSLYKFNPKTDTKWSILQSFTDKNINNITRLAVNKDATRLAFVAEISPENIVEEQIKAFNARNLEDFTACYAEDVSVRNFPNDTLYVGNEKLEHNYERFYTKNPKVSVTVTKKIVQDNTIINEEWVTIGDKVHRQVVVYTVRNGLISDMAFIYQKAFYADTEAVVQNQLNAYNARDIEAFLNTYSNDVAVYNYPVGLRYKGIQNMRDRYTDFFEATPDLNCEVKNRITIGTIAIDQEYITANGHNFGAVAIYEVKNDKITKVTFVR